MWDIGSLARIAGNLDLNGFQKYAMAAAAFVLLSKQPSLAMMAVLAAGVYAYAWTHKPPRRCRPATIDNPYANSLYTTADAALPACDIDEVEQEHMLTHNLYMPSTDLFRRALHRGRFMQTTQTTHPGDQRLLSTHLYAPPTKTCKSDNIDCLQYEDVRYHR